MWDLIPNPSDGRYLDFPDLEATPPQGYCDIEFQISVDGGTNYGALQTVFANQWDHQYDILDYFETEGILDYFARPIRIRARYNGYDEYPYVSDWEYSNVFYYTYIRPVRVWNGSIWAGRKVKFWNGSWWVYYPDNPDIWVWNGSEWVNV